MNLKDELSEVLRPLVETLPIDQAMGQLVVAKGASPDLIEMVETICREDAITEPLQAGLWLYVDELSRSHHLSQTIKTPTGSFWHAIMHRLEGDFSNAHYWFNLTGPHPAMDVLQNYDPHKFVDEVANAQPNNPETLLQMQRDEWSALFEWCATTGEG